MARPPAPSFALAPALLYTTTTEIFDLYRSLIRSHFAEQLQSVPTLSMQVYNDSIHLSDRVTKLAETYQAWSSSEVQRKLREFGEGCFERELTRQRDSLVGTLDTIEWNRGVEGFKRGARIPGQIRSDLEDLSRMFHVSPQLSRTDQANLVDRTAQDHLPLGHGISRQCRHHVCDGQYPLSAGYHRGRVESPQRAVEDITSTRRAICPRGRPGESPCLSSVYV
jgi:hypothetical protein